MALNRSQIQLKYPEVYESYMLQLSIPDSKYEDKLKSWKDNNISCFSRWMVPYFLEREKERKRPCLKLNYPTEGKCNDCMQGSCRYDKVCFMCGQEGHGAFQTFPGGKLKGELKCSKHSNFLSQMASIQSNYGLDEDDVREIFKPSSAVKGSSASTAKAPVKVAAPNTPSSSASSSSSSSSTAVTPPASPSVGNPSNATSTSTTKAAPVVNQWKNPSSLIKTAPGQSSTAAKAGNNVSSDIKSTTSNPSLASNSSSNSLASSTPPSPLMSASDVQPKEMPLPPQSLPTAPSSSNSANKLYSSSSSSSSSTPVGLNGSNTSSSNPTSSPSQNPNPNARSTFPFPGGGSGADSYNNLHNQIDMHQLQQRQHQSPSQIEQSASISAMSSTLLSSDRNSNFWTGLGQSSGNSLLSSTSTPGRNDVNLTPTRPSHSPNSLSLDGISLNGLRSNNDHTGLLNGDSIFSGGWGNAAGGGLVGVSSHFSSNNGNGINNINGSPQSQNSLLGELNSISKVLSGGDGLGMGGNQTFLQQQQTQQQQQQQQQSTFLKPASPGLNGISGTNSMNSSGTNAGLSAGVGPSSQLSPITHEVMDGDEYGVGSVLRFSLSTVLKDGQGTSGIFYRGNITSYRGSEDVAVFAWRKNNLVDYSLLRQEIKALRLLASSSNNLIARIMHRGHLDIPASTISGGVELSALCTELSELGYLDSYLMTHKTLHPEGFVSADLQAFCCQLIDTVIKCHQSKITHRNICPSSVLVCRGNTFQVNQSVSNLVLKLCSFRLASLSKIAKESEVTQWVAPESDAISRNTGVGYQLQSDLWSLGLLIYYIATCGQCPFVSHAHAKEAIMSDVSRRLCLEAHNLHNSCPMLYDLIERLVRPIHTRAPISLVRCHPFLWTTTTRRNIIIDFTNTLTSPPQPMMPPQRAQVIENIINSLNRFAPKFVFGSEGWCIQMNKEYLPFVQPVSLRTEFWWSALHLLQAIRNQLLYPEALHAARYTRHTPHQFLNLYLKQTLDHDFPRLLVLLFELGVVHGKWEWDGDEANFMWSQA